MSLNDFLWKLLDLSAIGLVIGILLGGALAIWYIDYQHKQSMTFYVDCRDPNESNIKPIQGHEWQNTTPTPKASPD